MNLDDSLLGKPSHYPKVYSPNILQSIPRAPARNALGFETPLPFAGLDLWTAYELSWLDLKGKPQVRIGEITIACDSQCLVESKSLKLYLNSLNNERYSNDEHVSDLMLKDIESCVKGAVSVSLWSVDQFHKQQSSFAGSCIDNLDISCGGTAPDAGLLCTGNDIVTEALYSHLLKTNCPVTGQPDWASVWIDYQGPKIDRPRLLQYLVSYRQHQDFHENCVERILLDILAQCKPQKLAIYARYTRRGGLDINPFRYCGGEAQLPDLRITRQ